VVRKAVWHTAATPDAAPGEVIPFGPDPWKPSAGVDPDEAMLFCSQDGARLPPPLIMSSMQPFFSYPAGYYLMGYWGHGVNSYALYYLRIDAWSKVYFRLPYGGFYTDNLRMAILIRQFLPSYFEFEQQVKGRVKMLEAVEAMLPSRYRIVRSDGKVIEREQSLLGTPDFAGQFHDLLADI
jgi:hypothetical protein